MSCLFDALSFFIEDLTGQELRNDICNFLSHNPPILDDIPASEITNWENNFDLKTYINKMRQSSTWGGGIEIACFCRIYEINVIVNFNGKEIEFKSPTPSNNSIRIFYNGNHYEPIRFVE